MMLRRLSIVVALSALPLTACHKNEPATPAASGPAAAVAPPAGKAWSDVVSATPDGGMLMGNPEAPIKLLEYGSLSCPHCAHLAQEGMAKITGTYVASGKVSYEYRSFAIHPQDVPLTVLVHCAPDSAFFGLVEQIYLNFDAMNARVETGIKQAQAAMQLPAAQRLVTMADALGYTDFFAARGVPLAKAHACLSDTAAAEKIAKLAEDYGNKGVDSTPTLLINGAKISAATWPEVEAELQRDGAR